MSDRDLFDELPHGLVAIQEPERILMAARWVHGPRYSIPTYRIESVRFKKGPLDLRPYESPIMDIIAANSVKNLQEGVDAWIMESITSSSLSSSS